MRSCKLRLPTFPNIRAHLLKVLCTIIVISSHSIVSAQYFEAGINAGITASQIHGDSYGGYHKPGIQAGFCINHSISEDWKLGFELNYAQRGTRKIPRPDKGDYNALYINLQYIDLPIIVQYKLKKFVFAAGLSAGRLVGQSLRNENGNTFTVPPLQNMDYNLLAEIDYQPIKNLSIFARSFNSMLPIRRWGPISLRFNYGWYNIVMVLGVKYEFNGK